MNESLTEPTFWILTALIPEPRHGYAILRDVETLSRGEVSLRVTTLYAALERLERAGLIVTSGEEVVDGRARRYYRITPDGSTSLTAEVDRLRARTRAARKRLAAARPSPAGAMAASA